MESIFELTHNRTNLIQTRFEFKSVEEAPSYYPTEDEFIDPLVFIEQIRPVAEKYGICKIIPPKTWKPKFAIDMNNFKFKPRIQRLNELEANSRIKLNFLDKLSKFHELQGNKFKIPIVEKRPLDLYQLYKAVEKMGGYENLVTNKLWSQLIRQLDFKEATSARNVKIQYEKLLYPYLLFEADVTLPLNKTNKNDDSAIADDDYDHEDESESEFNSKAKKHAKKSNKQEIDAEKIELIKCLVCDRGDDEAFMLLCDGCDDSYHTFCLYPPLKVGFILKKKLKFFILNTFFYFRKYQKVIGVVQFVLLRYVKSQLILMALNPLLSIIALKNSEKWQTSLRATISRSQSNRFRKQSAKKNFGEFFRLRTKWSLLNMAQICTL